MTLVVGRQAKVLGEAAIGGYVLTNEAYHLSRPSSLSLSLYPLAYSSTSHLTITCSSSHPELSPQNQ